MSMTNKRPPSVREPWSERVIAARLSFMVLWIGAMALARKAVTLDVIECRIPV
jgi:hypothetical protein